MRRSKLCSAGTISFHSDRSGKIGVTRFDPDPCMYIKCYKKGLITIYLYAVGLCLAAITMTHTMWIKHILSGCFEIKNSGEGKANLGLKATRDRKRKVLWLIKKAWRKL